MQTAPERPNTARFAAAAVALTAVLAGCQSTPPLKALPVIPESHDPVTGLAESQVNFWDAEKYANTPGDAALKIDLSDQLALFYKAGQLVGRSRIATGIPGRSTPTGDFTILEKKVRKNSNLWGKITDADGNVVVSDAKAGRDPVPEGGRFTGASMPYWMRLTNTGIGMHAGPIPRPGRPASHGCIRMNRKMAPLFHNHAPLGTRVVIVE